LGGLGGTLVDQGQRVAGLLGEPLKAGIQCLPRPSRDIPPLPPKESMQAVGVVTCKLPNSHQPIVLHTELAINTMKTPTTGCILANDLGKYKSVACLYPYSADQAEIRFRSFDTFRVKLAATSESEIVNR